MLIYIYINIEIFFGNDNTLKRTATLQHRNSVKSKNKKVSDLSTFLKNNCHKHS